MENPVYKLTSKEAAAILLNTGIFEDFSIDYIKDIDGKFKCRLKQPWARAASGYTFYPSASWLLFDNKIDAIEDCLIHIRSMGGLSSVKFDDYGDESKKKISKKKEPIPEITTKVEESTVVENIIIPEEVKDFIHASDQDLENHLKELENN